MEHTILIVDDSERAREDIRDLLIDRLMALKVRLPVIIEVANGREAFKLLEAGLRPDLILLDYLMPEMNGVQLIDAIDATLRLDTPIIMFSMSIEIKSDVESRRRLFFLKGVREEMDDFYDAAVRVYRKSLRPHHLGIYRRPPAIKKQFAGSRGI
jgi:CheY-like chemotaxis protein